MLGLRRSGKSKVMFISLRSGAGLNGLQHVCSDVVVGELDWSPQVHKQLIGRVRRWGQLLRVTAHFLHVNGGSDPVIMEVLGLGPGRVVGEAYRHLLELRMEHGPLGEERATEELRAWWAARSSD